jgi:hypothetical protein
MRDKLGKLGKTKAKLKSWRMAWHEFRDAPAVKCGCCGGSGPRSTWRQLRHRPNGIRLQGLWYCQTDCLEWAIAEVLGQRHAASRREAVVVHRVPLGLLLLSRQQLTAAQLRTALEAQRSAGQGRIGEWLQQLGFASEEQITAALARQWACPVLRDGLEALGMGRLVPIPALLLESFQMIPVDFAAAGGTLLMAFGGGIDYRVLYAIEQMLGYRTEACFVCPSTLQRGLQVLAQRHGAKDVIFDRMDDAGECARIIGSYSARLGAEEVRLAQCGTHLWIRLEGQSRETVNLVFRAPHFVSRLASDVASHGSAPPDEYPQLAAV